MKTHHIVSIAAILAASIGSTQAQVTTQRVGDTLIIRDDNPGIKSNMPIVNPFESRWATCGQAGVRHAGNQVQVSTCRVWEFKPSKLQTAQFERGQAK